MSSVTELAQSLLKVSNSGKAATNVLKKKSISIALKAAQSKVSQRGDSSKVDSFLKKAKYEHPLFMHWIDENSTMTKKDKYSFVVEDDQQEIYRIQCNLKNKRVYTMVVNDSVSGEVVAKVKESIRPDRKIYVILDANKKSVGIIYKTKGKYVLKKKDGSMVEIAFSKHREETLYFKKQECGTFRKEKISSKKHVLLMDYQVDIPDIHLCLLGIIYNLNQ